MSINTKPPACLRCVHAYAPLKLSLLPTVRTKRDLVCLRPDASLLLSGDYDAVTGVFTQYEPPKKYCSSERYPAPNNQRCGAEGKFFQKHPRDARKRGLVRFFLRGLYHVLTSPIRLLSLVTRSL